MIGSATPNPGRHVPDSDFGIPLDPFSDEFGTPVGAPVRPDGEPEPAPDGHPAIDLLGEADADEASEPEDAPEEPAAHAPTIAEPPEDRWSGLVAETHSPSEAPTVPPVERQAEAGTRAVPLALGFVSMAVLCSVGLLSGALIAFFTLGWGGLPAPAPTATVTAPVAPVELVAEPAQAPAVEAAAPADTDAPEPPPEPMPEPPPPATPAGTEAPKPEVPAAERRPASTETVEPAEPKREGSGVLFDAPPSEPKGEEDKKRGLFRRR